MFDINGKKYPSLAEHGVAALVPSAKPVKVTPSADPFEDGPCRGLWVGVAGTINLLFADGTTASNFPVFPGLNQVSPAGVLPGGSADDIWAMY